MRFRPHVVLAFGALVTACAPFTPPPAVPLAETAQTLAKREIGITAAGGGGGLFLDGGAVGGAVRMRVGVGASQEVGLEGSALFVDAGNRQTGDPPWKGQSAAGSIKASWKLGLRPWAALIAGTGSTFSATGDAVGGDFGVVFSGARGNFRPYAGLRLTLAIPADHGVYQNGGITGGLVVPVGLNFVLNERVQLLLEAGLLTAWSYEDHIVSHVGGYGALAVVVRVGR